MSRKPWLVRRNSFGVTTARPYFGRDLKTIKYSFFAYVALIVLAVMAYAISRRFTPPRDPNTMYTIYISSMRSLDPIKIADVGSSDIMGHVWETLYNYRYGGKADELFPQLAADFAKVSDDGLTYTIPLRKGIRFYDPHKIVYKDGVGPELKASDVIFSWKRMADFNSAAPSYSTVLQDNIVGLDDFRDYTQKADKVDYNRPVEGLVALDDYTLQVKLTKPIPNFLQLTAYLGVAIVSRDAVEKIQKLGYDGMKENPIATGPYGVEFYQTDQRIILSKNPIYRGRPDVDGEQGAKLSPDERLPRIPRLQFDYALEVLPSYLLFMQKKYDVMSIPKEVYGDTVGPDGQISPELAKQGVMLLKRPDPGLYFMQFNMTDPVLGKNKPLRQAMSLALDREKFIRVYRNGRGKPGVSIFPPDASLYDPNYASKWCKFDLELARQKMKEAEAIQGGPIPALKLQMGDTDTEMRQYAEFFCRSWAAIGLNVTAEYNTYAHYLELLDQKSYQVTYTGWVPDYPDEKTYLRLFDATLREPPGSNTFGYANEEYQKILEKSLTMARSPERDKLYLQMRDILDEDLPQTPIFYPEVHALRYNWMSGYKIPLFNSGFYTYQTLDSAKRRNATMAGSGQVSGEGN